jgi:hypothetical protein
MAAPLHRADDLGRLFGRFALAEDNFWPAGSQRPVVIQLSEPDILVGKVAQLFDSGIYGHTGYFETVQKVSQSALFDGGVPFLGFGV